MTTPFGRRLAALLPALVAAGAVGAETGKAGPLLDRMLAALGGRKAIAALESLAVTADCSGPGGPFRTGIESWRPGSVYFRQTGDEGTAEIWSTPGRTWSYAADGAVEDLGAATRALVRGHEFHLLLFEVESRFSGHALGALTAVDGVSCRRIEMRDHDGRPAALCVGEADGLPLRLELHPEDAAGPLRITFGDWRTVDELRYFFELQLVEEPDRLFTYDYVEIRPGGVAADRFVAPVSPGRRADQEALLDLLRLDRRAHPEPDAGLLASHLAEKLLEVSAGGAWNGGLAASCGLQYTPA